MRDVGWRPAWWVALTTAVFLPNRARNRARMETPAVAPRWVSASVGKQAVGDELGARTGARQQQLAVGEFRPRPREKQLCRRAVGVKGRIRKAAAVEQRHFAGLNRLGTRVVANPNCDASAWQSCNMRRVESLSGDG